jgi:uncharacterized protein YfiM (DUF2279 family)
MFTLSSKGLIFLRNFSLMYSGVLALVKNLFLSKNEASGLSFLFFYRQRETISISWSSMPFSL